MEIKTCEQYVVNKIMELEDEVDRYDNLVRQQSETIRELEDQLKFVGKFLYLEKSNSPNEYYVDFKSRWSNYDKADYNRLCEIFKLEEPGLVTAEAEEEE